MEETKKVNEEGKKYAETLIKLKKIINNDNISLPKKIKSSDISSLISDLFEEEHENNRKSFKIELRELLKKHVEMCSEIEKKKKELKELESKKQKEFIDASKSLFDKIDGLDEIIKNYTNSLETVLEDKE